MRQYLVPTVLIAIFFIQSCSSGKKAFEHGNYYESVIKSVEKLRKNPDHTKSIETLQQAYPLAVDHYIRQISNLKITNDPFKNGKIVGSYQLLNRMYDEINRCPGALAVIPSPSSYFAEIQMHNEMAAEERYQAGISALETQDRYKAKEAYNHFNEVGKYMNGYKDTQQKMQEALYVATLKVVVEQVPVPTTNYQLTVQFFQDQVNEYLFNYNENPFVRFYQANDPDLQYNDQVLIIQFDDFIVGQMNNSKNTIEVSKDSVVVGEVTLESGEKQKVYNTVKAKFTEFQREVISKGTVSMRVVDQRTNQVVLHDKVNGEFRWISTWGSFNGDERALSPQQLKIAEQEPAMPPPHQDLFIEFCRPIYGQLRSKISAYYRHI